MPTITKMVIKTKMLITTKMLVFLPPALFSSVLLPPTLLFFVLWPLALSLLVLLIQLSQNITRHVDTSPGLRPSNVSTTKAVNIPQDFQ